MDTKQNTQAREAESQKCWEMSEKVWRCHMLPGCPEPSAGAPHAPDPTLNLSGHEFGQAPDNLKGFSSPAEKPLALNSPASVPLRSP